MSAIFRIGLQRSFEREGEAIATLLTLLPLLNSIQHLALVVSLSRFRFISFSSGSCRVVSTVTAHPHAEEIHFLSNVWTHFLIEWFFWTVFLHCRLTLNKLCRHFHTKQSQLGLESQIRKLGRFGKTGRLTPNTP